MSNYTSKDIALAPVTSSINLPLIQQVLQVKQGTYNQADAQIQAGLSSLENLKLLRPQDTEYLNSKIRGMQASLDNMQDKDLSNPNVASNYYYTIKSVARDPFVVEAASNTVKYQQFQAQMQDIQKKNPDKFHQINYQFALDKAGLNQYMEGATNSLGSFSYHNYSDVNKNLVDRLKTLKDLKGDRTIEIVGSGYGEGGNNIAIGEKQIKKLSGLTPEEIVKYVPGMMNTEDEMQLRINGWWTGKQNPQEVESQFSSYTQNKSQDYDSQITELKTTAENSANSEQKRNEARQKIATLQVEKEQFTKNITGANLEQKGYFLNKNEYVKSIAGMAGTEWNTTYTVDENYYAKEKLSLEYQNLQIKKETLQLAREKQASETLQANGTFSDSGRSLSPISGDIAQEIDPVAQVAQEFTNRNNDLIGSIQTVYNSSRVSEETRNQFDATMNSMGYTPTGELLDPKKQPTVSKADAIARAYEKSKMNLSDPESAVNIIQKKALVENIASDYNSSVGRATKEEFNSNPTKYVSQFLEKASALESIDSNLRTGSFGLLSSKQSTQSIITEVKSFIKEVGGSNNLKNIGNNIEKLEKFRDIMGRLEQEPIYTLTSNATNVNFNSNVDKLANKIISQGQSTRASFATNNQMNVSNEAEKSYIAGIIPSTETGRAFDTKKNSAPLTIYKRNVGGQPTLVVEQNVGFDEKNGKAKKAMTTLSPQSAGFEYLSRIADLDESNRGLNAEVAKKGLTIQTTPEFLESSKAHTAKVNSHLQKSIPPTSPYYQSGALLYNPSNYTTAESSAEAYQNALKGRYTTEQIATVSSHISNNISNYKLSLKPTDGYWNLSLDDKNTKYNYREGSTGQKYLEATYLDLVQNYPQTLIMDFFLKELLTDKNAYNKILNNGR